VVAVLLRLRFRILGNTLARNVVQLVAVILGACFAVMLLAIALGVLFIASTAPAEATQAVVVVGGTALVLGWWVVPLLFDGVDRTLDPQKLARFPLTTRQLMIAMFLVGIIGVPGIVSLVASLGTAIAWAAHPISALVAVGAGLIGIATCVVGSRLTTQAAGSLLRGRGAARVGIAALLVLVLVGPFAALAVSSGTGSRPGLFTDGTAVIHVLGLSPLGAIWSVPGRIALGDLTGAALATAVGLGTLAVLVVLWRLALVASPRSRGEKQTRSTAGGRLGPLAWMPSSPTGAVAARALIYWFRDGRLARQLVLIPLLPALMLLSWKLVHIDGFAVAIGPIVASLLPLSVFAGLSYDGTAYAAELAAGVRGLHDRLGRAIALLIIAGPATVVVQVVVAIVISRTDDLPTLLGLSLGILLCSIGVVSVSSARIVVPMARAGRNPFSAQPGASTVWIIGSYVVTGVTFVVAIPVLALAITAFVIGAPLIGWLALAGGIVFGGAAAVGGVVLGGRVLDAAGPTVLARLRLIRE
jgi:ABC-2 type transport system permease protein